MDHRTLSALNERDGWYRDKVPGSVPEPPPRGRQPAVSWLWAAPAAAVVLATALVGILRYGSLPARIPIHFSAAGAPNSFAGKSLGSAFFLVLTQIILTGLLVGLLRLAVQHGEQGLDPSDPAGAAPRRQTFQRRIGVGTLTLATGVDLTLMLAAFMTWGLVKFSNGSGVLLLLPTLVGATVLVVLAVGGSQPGARLHPGHPRGGGTPVVPRSDDRHWHRGAFYANRGDPAIVVPKRLGVGWTVNFGHPVSWILLVAIVGLVALPAFLLGR